MSNKRKFEASSRSVSPPNVKRRIDISNEASAKNENTPTIRIFSWNVNGIKALLQKQLSFDKASVSPLRQFLERHRWPDFLCLQEVKISPSDVTTQRQLQYAANSGGDARDPTYIVRLSLPRDKYNATGFGGRVHGVATLIRKEWEEHLEDETLPEYDLEGRVLIHEIKIGHQVLVVINGYWVNGTFNPYRNTETGAVQDTRHDHKLRFHAHMLNESLSSHRQGKHVLLVGDMNVAPDRIDGHPNLRTSPVQHVKNREDFNKKFFWDSNGFRGIDVFRQLHGDVKKYTYHPRGIGWGQSCDRVDNIIASPKLFACGAIVATDICDNPQDRGHSDHVPLWVEVNPKLLTSIEQPDAADALPAQELTPEA